MGKGLIHIYYGDGKGKTTAALGLALRALGNGYSVILVQFMKTRETGELSALARFPALSLIRGKLSFGFSWELDEEQKARLRGEHDRMFSEALGAIPKEERALLILDEILPAYQKNLIDRAMVVEFLKGRPQAEVVLTGRKADEKLIQLADYVSESRKIKHPFELGIKARAGVEY